MLIKTRFNIFICFICFYAMFFVGCSEQSDNSSHTKASAHQTVQKEKKNDTTEKKYNEIDEDKAEEHLLKMTEEIYQYLLENDWKSLHDIIHPEEGIIMTFHRMLDAYREFPIPTFVEDPNFSRFDFLDSIQQNERVFWGFSNTDDYHYFYMTISDYINHFLSFSDRRLPPQSCVGQSPATGGR
ncbi:MAG TPA: hypothetical protein VIG73_13560 [Cerasibacillus sp.]|uniref:hypothetical protein n=1 Tax=Cerasibacillus sp. TaxID=2498711 RepID=UPI002F424200